MCSAICTCAQLQKVLVLGYMTPVSCMYLYRVADEGVVEAVPVSGPREADIVVRVEPDLHRGPANIKTGKVLEFGHKKSNFPHMG